MDLECSYWEHYPPAVNVSAAMDGSEAAWGSAGGAHGSLIYLKSVG